MRAIAALLAAALLCTARGADQPGALLSPGPGEGAWAPLIATLAAKGQIVAPFTELRHFPFRREPTVLKGILRISPERGLSLQYTDPSPNVLIADSSGLLTRDAGGRSRALPAGSRQAGAVAALLTIMRFDIAALYPRFEIRARGDAIRWGFDFVPRGADDARALGTISVEGTASDVHHLVFKRSSTQWIEIQVGDTRSGVPFTPAELEQFFG
jgi:hypothetical protein